MSRVVVLGGGVSGLTAAFLSCRAFSGSGINGSVSLVEGTSRLGGWFCSDRQDGFLFEKGPHSFRPRGESGRSAVRLLEELGIQDVALANSERANHRYLWLNGAMRHLSGGLLGMLCDSSLRPVLSAAIIEAFSTNRRLNDSSPKADESIHAFFERRFGNYVAENMANPLVQGIFAGNPRQLSVAACFPLIQDLENRYGSVARGMLMSSLVDKWFSTQSSVVLKTAIGEKLTKATAISFPNGINELVDHLEQQLFSESNETGDVRKELLVGESKRVAKIESDSVITLHDGSVLEADYILSSLPLQQLIQVLPDEQASILRPLSINTKFASVGVVNIGYNNMEIELPFHGFGHLIPTKERQGVLGIIYDSDIFPQQQPQNSVVLTVMLGGAMFPEISDMPLEQMTELALKKVREHLGLSQQPCATFAASLKDCIPQYGIGHAYLVKEARAKLLKTMPQMRIFGNSFNGVGISDSIAHARKAVDSLELGIR